MSCVSQAKLNEYILVGELTCDTITYIIDFIS